MEKEILRKVQLVQLEIAKEIKRICEKHNISYWMDGGTLLGAVRHGGFIPWDDDLDLGMLRAEYERFLKVLPAELDSQYELVDWHTVTDYPHNFCKIMKKNTVYVEEKLAGSSKCGIWVDIFPYDIYPEGSAAKALDLKLMVCRAMIRAKCHWNSWSSEAGFNIKKWIKNAPFRLASIFFAKSKLVEIYENTAVQFNDLRNDMIFTQSVDSYGAWRVPYGSVEETTMLSFEDDRFAAPSDYDRYLTYGYGEYMKLPPEDQRENRHGIVRVEFGE